MGGRFTWFILGIGVGVWASYSLKRRLRKVNVYRQISKRARNIGSELKNVVSEGRDAIRRYAEEAGPYSNGQH